MSIHRTANSTAASKRLGIALGVLALAGIPPTAAAQTSDEVMPAASTEETSILETRGAGLPAAPPAASGAGTTPAVAPASQATAAPAPDAVPIGDHTAVMGGEHRRLNGHSFVTPVGFPGAFTNSTVAMASGFGMLEFEGLSFFEALGGNEVPKTSRVFFYGYALGGQVAVANRFGIELGAVGAVAVAGDLEDLLAIGALATLSVDAVPKVRIWTFDAVGLQLTGGVGVNYSRSLRAIPANAVFAAAEALQAAESIDDLAERLATVQDSVIVQQERVVVAPSLMIAEGAGAFGVQVTIQPKLTAHQQSSQPTESDQSHALTTGGQLELDISNFSRYAPVVLAAGYVNSYQFDTGDAAHELTGALLYSGRRDLSVGLIATHEIRVPIRSTLGRLGMQYFF